MTDRTQPGQRKAKARWRRVGVTCAVIGLAASGVAAANAGPGSMPTDDGTLRMSYPAKDAIDGRDRPTNDAKRTTDVYHAGDQVEVDCQTTGDVAGGSPIWDYTSKGYYIPDYLIKTGTDGFVNDLPRCSEDVPQPEPQPQPRPEGKPRVVALGDSWASGDGSGDYDPATQSDENKCLRSKHSGSARSPCPVSA